MNIIDKNLQFKGNYSLRQADPTGFVLHHAAANGSVEDVHNWHLSLGWAGIGYHFYVRKDGSVYRGRPENWIGAHTSGHNEKLGICAEGNFEEDRMADAQVNAIMELLAYLRRIYGDLPVYGHRDLDATACPGKYYPFATIVEGKESQPDPNAVTVILTTLGKGDTGAQVKALQRLLAGLGYDLGSYGPFQNGADGIFGAATESGVKAYQRLHGLVEDGLVGQKTWRSLLGSA